MNLSNLKKPTQKPLIKIPFWLNARHIMKIKDCEKSKAYEYIHTFKATHINEWEDKIIESKTFLEYHRGEYTEDLILRVLNH